MRLVLLATAETLGSGTPDLRLLELTQLKDYSGASDSYLR